MAMVANYGYSIAKETFLGSVHSSHKNQAFLPLMEEKERDPCMFEITSNDRLRKN